MDSVQPFTEHYLRRRALGQLSKDERERWSEELSDMDKRERAREKRDQRHIKRCRELAGFDGKVSAPVEDNERPVDQPHQDGILLDDDEPTVDQRRAGKRGYGFDWVFGCEGMNPRRMRLGEAHGTTDDGRLALGYEQVPERRARKWPATAYHCTLIRWQPSLGCEGVDWTLGKGPDGDDLTRSGKFVGPGHVSVFSKCNIRPPGHEPFAGYPSTRGWVGLCVNLSGPAYAPAIPPTDGTHGGLARKVRVRGLLGTSKRDIRKHERQQTETKERANRMSEAWENPLIPDQSMIAVSHETLHAVEQVHQRALRMACEWLANELPWGWSGPLDQWFQANQETYARALLDASVTAAEQQAREYVSARGLDTARAISKWLVQDCHGRIKDGWWLMWLYGKQRRPSKQPLTGRLKRVVMGSRLPGIAGPESRGTTSTYRRQDKPEEPSAEA